MSIFRSDQPYATPLDKRLGLLSLLSIIPGSYPQSLGWRECFRLHRELSRLLKKNDQLGSKLQSSGFEQFPALFQPNSTAVHVVACFGPVSKDTEKNANDSSKHSVIVLLCASHRSALHALTSLFLTKTL